MTGDGHDASFARADHEASLTFAYPDERRARVVERSVRREAGDIDGDRSRTSVARDGATVRVRVAATDLVGLRAGLNTWFGLVGAAERAADAAEEYAPTREGSGESAGG